MGLGGYSVVTRQMRIFLFIPGDRVGVSVYTSYFETKRAVLAIPY